MSHELPDVQAVQKLLDVQERAEEPEIKLHTSVGSSKKQESSSKTSTSALLTMPKRLIVWITKNCGKFFAGIQPQWIQGIRSGDGEIYLFRDIKKD